MPNKEETVEEKKDLLESLEYLVNKYQDNKDTKEIYDNINKKI